MSREADVGTAVRKHQQFTIFGEGSTSQADVLNPSQADVFFFEVKCPG